MPWFRGGLVFKAYRLLYHSTLGLRVIKKKKEGRTHELMNASQDRTLPREGERLVIYCQTTGVSAAPATHCATYCTPCRPLIRAFSGWIRTPLLHLCGKGREPLRPEISTCGTPVLPPERAEGARGNLAHRKAHPPRNTAWLGCKPYLASFRW